jgi:hypothetical protein
VDQSILIYAGRHSGFGATQRVQILGNTRV